MRRSLEKLRGSAREQLDTEAAERNTIEAAIERNLREAFARVQSHREADVLELKELLGKETVTRNALEQGIRKAHVHELKEQICNEAFARETSRLGAGAARHGSYWVQHA